MVTPAFNSRPGCPIPVIPKLELPLLDDCLIPEAPDPIFEAPEIDPIIDPPDIGCPPIQFDVDVEPLQQDYDYSYAIDPALRVQLVWTRSGTLLGTLEFVSDDPEIQVTWGGFAPPTVPYTAPIEITNTVQIQYQITKGVYVSAVEILDIVFDDVIGAPLSYTRLSGFPAKYAKPLPLVQGYAKFESNVQYRDEDYCAPDIDLEVQIPELVVPCPTFDFQPGTQEVWGKPYINFEIEPKADNSTDCDFDFEVNIQIPADCVLALNISGQEILAGHPLEIVGRGKLPPPSETEYLLVDLPSADNVESTKIVFPVGTLGISDPDNFGCVHGGVSLILVEYEGDDPTVGGGIGVQADNVKFKKGNSGFKALAVDLVNKKAWVRPEGGGVASILGVVAGGCNPGPNTFNRIQVFADGSWSATADPLITGFILDRY